MAPKGEFLHASEISRENTMRKSICILLLVAALATVLAEGDRKPYPYRWVHGLNGMAFSAGLDQLDQKTPDYFQRLKRVREICAERKVAIIPSFFSAGYGGSVLTTRTSPPVFPFAMLYLS